MGILNDLESRGEAILDRAEETVTKNETVLREALEDFRAETREKAEGVFTRIGRKLGEGNVQAWTIVGALAAFAVGVIVVSALS